jgi:surface polysaccharide O-acyltransferase-like enzyme
MIFRADTSYCYQFWYLYVLVGIYLLIPIFKVWTDKYIKPESNLSSECLILCACWLIISIVLPTICNGFGISSEIWFGAFKGFSGYLFFVICGRVYECIDADKRLNKLFLIILFVFVIQFVFFVTMIFLGKYNIIESWYGYHSFFTWNMASVLYLFVKKINFSKINIIIKKAYTVIAKYSLQIYILHVIVLQIIRKIGFTNDLINPWIYPIVIVIITVSVCLLIAYIGKKIPVIKHLF